jgi:hypothetical protein
MHKNNLRPVLLGHTENNYFGNQILQICHVRHAIAATSYHGSESKLNRLRHLPSGHRVLFDCEFGMIHGLGILSDAPATELLRKIRVVKSWNEEEVPEGATIPLWGPGSKSAEIYLSVLYARSTPEFHLPFPVTLYRCN